MMGIAIQSASASVLQREIERFVAAARERCEYEVDHPRRSRRRYHRSWPLLVRSEVLRHGEDVSVALHNASEMGIAFLAEDRISTGSTVFLKLFWHEQGSPRVPATVRHCTQVEHGYLVGCEFALADEAVCNRAVDLAAAWYD